MAVITVEVPKRVLQEFHAAAKKAYPLEVFAYLIGSDAGSIVIVEELYIPEDVADYCTTGAVYTPAHWEIDAREHARDSDLVIVGSIHSHPYRYAETDGRRQDAVPSEGDHEAGWVGLCGICVVSETKSGKLRARTRFHGPAHRVNQRVA